MTFPKHIHCIGVGGIGLSALVQLLRHEGHDVTGSDRSESPVTDLLVSRGISVVIGHSAEAVPAGAELVIYSDAVPEDNPERTEAVRRGVPSMSYFEALGKVSEGKRTIAVSGTHGKTTTTAMITKMLVDLGHSPTAIIGSLTKDFESNFVPGTSDIFVVEACEYRRHFLHLSPRVLVITNIEWDHTDYFKAFPDVIAAFSEMAQRVPADGTIVCNGNDYAARDAISHVNVRKVEYQDEDVPTLSLIGEFNVQNAKAAKAAVLALIPELDRVHADASLSSFKGTWRRFDFKGKTPEGALVYDDYAHHPSAIAATLTGAREKFPDARIFVAFHPHLYSRTKDLLGGFAETLGLADVVLIAPIYAAREQPDPEVSSEVLAHLMRRAGKRAEALPDFDHIHDLLRADTKEGDVIITMGAGDIYKVADRLVSEH